MILSKYKRSLEELAVHSVLFWPAEVREKVAAVDFGARLIDSHDQFIGIVSLAKESPEAWFKILEASELSGNLFLKHLLLISDVAVEGLKKLNPLYTQFPEGTIKYEWNGMQYQYKLKETNSGKISSAGIRTGASQLIEDHILDGRMYDLCMLVLYGAFSTNAESFENADLLSRCNIGQYLGDHDALVAHAQRLYLSVGNQSAGAGANARGQALQNFVISILREDLPLSEGWQMGSGKILGVQAAPDRETTFDLVVRGPNNKITGVEISFQETTNSTIERKAREARDVQAQLHVLGHALAFVLDGVGNIRIRRRASATICANSDCTVGFSRPELRVLANFLRERSGLPVLPDLTP